MGVVSTIRGALGIPADVTSNNGVKVVVTPALLADMKRGEQASREPYSAIFADSAGSTDMGVDGSATAVEFVISAGTEDMIVVNDIRLLFHSTNMDVSTNDSRRFGSTTAPGLTNGLTLQYIDSVGETVDLFSEPVKVIGQFLTFAKETVNYSNAVAASTDYFLVVANVFTPIVLFPGTRDRIVITVQDDLSNLTASSNRFASFAAGYQVKA